MSSDGTGWCIAAASLGVLGYNVKVFCISASPRRAHSIAAQGGINAAKNYQNDNDSVFRLFYDTIRGVTIVPVKPMCIVWPRFPTRSSTSVWHREFFCSRVRCLLDNRSFGGAQVSRTFYARGQTGQQLLLGAYAPSTVRSLKAA